MNFLRKKAMAEAKKPLTYKDSGVDISAGNELVEMIKPLAKSTMRAGADSELGGFGALFDMAKLGYKDPILVSSTDGVGTKLKLAIEAGKHDTIGIDLVAMCVNDILAQGAEPLFFLDYFACGRLNPEKGREIISGIAEGCRQAGAALVGGETAEMPGMYQGDDYDLAGFAVGVVERNAILPRGDMKEGDALIGLASTGLHSNGYSLARKVAAGKDFDKAALLASTRIYVKTLLPLVKNGLVKGLAHITGGGITENLPRILPKGLAAEIALGSWKIPEIFRMIQSEGGVEEAEMLRTFNCGIGMIAVVAEEKRKEVIEALEKSGEKIFEIGRLAADPKGPLVRYKSKLF